MFSFLHRDAPAAGRVLYPGTIPPPVGQLGIRGDVASWTPLPVSPQHVWAVEASHPVWGVAEIRCEREARPIPDELIEHVLSLTDEEKARARRGAASVEVRVPGQKQVLKDRKRLLWWLRALLRSEGAVAYDSSSSLLWSEAMLDDELAHDADLDIESLYAIHAVHASGDTSGVSWLHTHGLAELGAFDVDVLEPADLFVQNCGDPVRALAFAALEGSIAPDTDRFTLVLPNGDIRLVPADRFQAQAAPEHQQLRDGVEGHTGRRAVVCEPAGGLFGRFRSRPRPSRLFACLQEGGLAVPFSQDATSLMAERARKTLPVFSMLRDEFSSLDLPVVVKLGYEVDGGGPADREHLWFAVHDLHADSVEGTLMNAPHRVSRLSAGARGRHPLERLTDWLIMSPEGSMTPRNFSAARRLRVTRSAWQERVDAATRPL